MMTTFPDKETIDHMSRSLRLDDREELLQEFLDAGFVRADVEDTVWPAHVWRECAYKKTTEAGKLRRALQEVAHLTTWLRSESALGQIERVVKTALEEAHDD